MLYRMVALMDGLVGFPASLSLTSLHLSPFIFPGWFVSHFLSFGSHFFSFVSQFFLFVSQARCLRSGSRLFYFPASFHFISFSSHFCITVSA